MMQILAISAFVAVFMAGFFAGLFIANATTKHTLRSEQTDIDPIDDINQDPILNNLLNKERKAHG